MSETDALIMGVDLGGTNIEAAAVREGRVLASSKKRTLAGEGARAVVGRIEMAVREVMGRLDAGVADFAALCIGAPGVVDRSSGVVREAPNLGWKDVALGEVLHRRLGLPILVDNDVTIGALGEHAYGAGEGALHMVAIFVGTGVGGGIILNGEPHHGWRGAAGEVGHMVVQPRGRRCPCGRLGCVEAYASKTGMEEMLQERREGGSESIVFELMGEKNKDRLTSGVVSAALARGDPDMEEVLETAQYYLGLLAANLVNTIDPEVIVFGGGLVEELGESFVEPIARTAREHFLVRIASERIRLVPTALGDDAGPVGAAVLARRHLREACA